MEDKLVSIIMPTYNCAKFIGKTIESVIAQTYENWELIIVDDCSKDNTEEVVSKYKDNRIKYHRLENNSGAAVARTEAMKKARGSYMSFLDSDDLWKKDKLEKQLEFMNKNNYNFTCTEYEQILSRKPDKYPCGNQQIRVRISEEIRTEFSYRSGNCGKNSP